MHSISITPSPKTEYFPTANRANSFLESIWPRLRHEIRVLLPYTAAIVGCELLMTSFFFVDDATRVSRSLGFALMLCGGCAIAVFPVAVCALCLQSFLEEYLHATLPQLIVQPISRRQLWLEKSGATALLLLFSSSVPTVLFMLGLFARWNDSGKPKELLLDSILWSTALAWAYLACLLFMAPLLATIIRRSLPSLIVLVVYAFSLAGSLIWIADYSPIHSEHNVARMVATSLLVAIASVTYFAASQRFASMEVR
jgi:ABC-type transport system involved in multi-copper enzyme maturation permease subunit